MVLLNTDCGVDLHNNTFIIYFVVYINLPGRLFCYPRQISIITVPRESSLCQYKCLFYRFLIKDEIDRSIERGVNSQACLTAFEVCKRQYIHIYKLYCPERRVCAVRYVVFM